MFSMTGFGYEEFQNEKLHLTLELKSYNNRYLDLIINLPPPLSPLEPRVRSILTERLKRGRVELYMRMRELEEDISIHIDNPTAAEYAGTMRKLMKDLSINEELHLGHLLRMEGVLKIDKHRDLELLWEHMEPLLRKALDQLTEERKVEGAATRDDILNQISIMEEIIVHVEKQLPEIEKRINSDLRSKFQEIVGSEIDENRILNEIAAFLGKHDINEEVNRLKTHFINFRKTAESKEPVGKKLDFLCQEMNREINTIGSKSGSIDISQQVITAKNCLEKVREQLRNVE